MAFVANLLIKYPALVVEEAPALVVEEAPALVVEEAQVEVEVVVIEETREEKSKYHV